MTSRKEKRTPETSGLQRTSETSGLQRTSETSGLQKRADSSGLQRNGRNGKTEPAPRYHLQAVGGYRGCLSLLRPNPGRPFFLSLAQSSEDTPGSYYRWGTLCPRGLRAGECASLRRSDMEVGMWRDFSCGDLPRPRSLLSLRVKVAGPSVCVT